MSRKKLLWAIGLTILVLWGLGRLLSSSSHDYHKVRLRIDDGVASPESWTEATDHRALFASDEVYDTNGHYAGTGGRIGFAKRLAGATTLIFEFTPFDGSPQTARFNLRGLDTHLDKVAEACSWPIQ
jgi:Type VI secretion system VasI, EvfG, VC_A0118